MNKLRFRSEVIGINLYYALEEDIEQDPVYPGSPTSGFCRATPTTYGSSQARG